MFNNLKFVKVRKNDSICTAYSRSGLLQDAADLGEAYIMLYAATFEKKTNFNVAII